MVTKIQFLTLFWSIRDYPQIPYKKIVFRTQFKTYRIQVFSILCAYTYALFLVMKKEIRVS